MPCSCKEFFLIKIDENFKNLLFVTTYMFWKKILLYINS